MELSVYRNGQAIAQLPIDEGTVFSHKLMGEHKITASGILSRPLAVQVGDYIQHANERFYLNAPPSVEKVNNFTYVYDLVFEGEIYYLYNKLFMDEGQSDFSYTGTPAMLIDLLLTNINSIQSGWSAARIENLEPRNISFNGDTCRTALSKVAEAFGLEYRLAGKSIYLQKSVGFSTTHSFSYGRNNGLYTISRDSLDDKNLVTRVFGFGASKNIDFDYRSGASRLVFEQRFLDKNTSLYGVREGAATFDDIFPQRTGTVTAVNTQDIFEFTDMALDFDINQQLIEGTVAKVVFKSGALSGYQFEIKRYLNSSKKIVLIPFVEENGYTLPNTLNYPEVGDQYTLVDIKMPASYIVAAENELRQRTQEFLNQNSVPRVTYAIDIDEKYVRDNAVDLKVGNLVQVVDTALGVDSAIRVSEISYPLVNTAQVRAIISDTIPYTVQERLIADTIDNLTLTKNTDRRRAELARTSVARLRQLQDLIFDPDDYFDPGKIKPQSIETLMLSVGAKSQNFGLLGVSMQANDQGNPARFMISGGQLVHYEIEIDGLGYVWTINARTFTNLDPAKPYYLSASCSNTSLDGFWELSEVPRATEAVAGRYLFNLGILYAVENSRRDFDFTNGMTFINGDTITTGRINSLDGLSYFDLTEGKFKVGDTDSSFDWNVTAANRLTIKGALLQSQSGDSFPATTYRGVYSSTTTYYKGDVVTYNGSSWVFVNDFSNINKTPADNIFWDVYALAGADGQPGDDGESGPGLVFRGQHSDTAAYYNNVSRRDVVLQGGIYYIYNGPDGAINTFTPSQWESFGAQFTSVATDTLLAENANIADFILIDGKISSQAQQDNIPRMILNGEDGFIRLRSLGSVFTQGLGSEAAVNRVNIDSSTGRLRIQRDPTANQSGSDVQVESDGISINFAGQSAGTGIRAGVKADVRARMDLIGNPNEQAIAAFFGRAQNVGTGITQAPTFGGIFESLMAKGLYLNTRIVTSATQTLNETDVFVYATSSTINLPVEKANLNGRTIIIWARNTVTVVGSTAPIQLAHQQGSTAGSPISLTNQVGMFIMSAGIWRFTRFD